MKLAHQTNLYGAVKIHVAGCRGIKRGLETEYLEADSYADWIDRYCDHVWDYNDNIEDELKRREKNIRDMRDEYFCGCVQKAWR